MRIALARNIRKIRRRVLTENSPILLFSLAALCLLVALLFLRNSLVDKVDDIVVELCGFFFDIILFGVILTIYGRWLERKRKIRNYHDQLDDFRTWKGEEGVLRKVGIIRRLNEMKAPLPSLWSANLQGANLMGANLQGANLGWAELQRAHLRKANLQGVNLAFANLQNANLWFANLQGANLSYANLQDANLWFANLQGARLFHTNLEGVNLCSANLQGACLTGANLQDTDMRYADLTGAEDLTWKQLKGAKIDDKTKLPDYLKREDREKEEEESE